MGRGQSPSISHQPLDYVKNKPIESDKLFGNHRLLRPTTLHGILKKRKKRTGNSFKEVSVLCVICVYITVTYTCVCACVYIHIHSTIKKKCNLDICKNIDGPRGPFISLNEIN